MIIQNEGQLEKLKKIGKIVANCLQYLGKSLKAGMTTSQINDLAKVYLESYGAKSAPITTYKFPGWVCISVNEEMAHGIPGNRIINEGDLVNIDVSAELDGIFADTGGSFPVGKVNQKRRDVCTACKEALETAIKTVKAGENLNRIGYAIESTARKYKLNVVRDLGSHGVGNALHEEPKFIPGFFNPSDRRTLTKGMVITIEPFITTGKPSSKQAADGWTLLNSKGSATAQYEHTMVVTDGDPIIVTLPDLN